MAAVSWDPTNPQTSRRLPDIIVPLQKAPYASTNDTLPNRIFSSFAFWPQFSRCNWTGAFPPENLVSFKQWVYTGLFERTFTLNPGDIGNVVGGVPHWYANQISMLSFHSPTVPSPTSTLSDYIISAPIFPNNIVYPSPPIKDTQYIVPFGIPIINLGGGLAWVAELDMRFCAIGKLTQALNMDFIVWPQFPNVGPFVYQNAFDNPAGFNLHSIIPELRRRDGLLPLSDVNWILGSSAVGQARPRIYKVQARIPTFVMTNSHVVVDNPTLDAFFNVAGNTNAQPSIADNCEGWIFSFIGTFEGSGPMFFIWVSCDGLYYRLLRHQSTPEAIGAMGIGSSRLMAQDPIGNYYFASDLFMGGQIFTSFGLTLTVPRRILPSFPPLSLPCTPIKDCC